MNIGRIGPSVCSQGGTVVTLGHYADYSLALVSINKSGEREAVLTVCLAPHGPKAIKGYVWLKGWSENDGIPEALEEAKLVMRTGKKYKTGFAEAELAKLLVPFE